MNERIPESNEPSRTNENNGSRTGDGETEASHEKPRQPEPIIYVTDLTAHTCGITHGVWIDAAREPSEIYDDIHKMLAASPFAIHHYGAASEIPTAFAIHGYEQFGNRTIRSDASIDLVSKIARGIKQHGYTFAAWADIQEGDPELLDHFEKCYLGHYESLEAYAEQGLEDRQATAELNKLVAGSELADLQSYVRIDVAAIARDLFCSGDVTVYKAPDTLGGGVWLFDDRA